MIGVSDIVFGWVLSRLLAQPETRSPAVVFPPSPGTAPTSTPPATTQPQPATTTPPVAQLPPTTFPTQVPPAQPTTSTVPGFKKAVEVWEVQPAIARQAGQTLVGMGFPEDVGAAMSLQVLEQQFPKGWQGKRSATPEEAANAKALLPKWKNGGVVFMGPPTFAGRRAYRMTQHPASASPTTVTTAPTAVPTTPQPATVPASFPTKPPAATPAPTASKPPAATPAPSTPAPVVTTLPEVLITADAPQSTPAPSTGPLVTIVRKGEGLAQVAKRLGKPENATSAGQIRDANVPNGPDAQWSKQDLSKGGLKKAGRAGGLQPGDRLFVPPAWGPVDAARL
jgi:hypothetical protein